MPRHESSWVDSATGTNAQSEVGFERIKPLEQ